MGKVFEAVHDARVKWYEFGLQLGVDDITLASIETEQRGDVAKCLRKMLAQWLSKRNCAVSDITKALRSVTVGKVKLADRLEHTLASHVLESRKRGRSPESVQTELSPIPKRVCGPNRSKFANYLEDIYNTIQLPSDKKYDLSSVRHYINLVCMKKNDRDRNLAHRAVHGDIAESISKESSIDLTDIAPKVGTLVLVEGAPGIGKTTLSHELCRQWSSGSLLTRYRLVLLIKLRDKNMQQASNFDDLLKYISENCLASSFESIHSEVTQDNGAGVLFILEGLDELQASAREDENSVFMKLIKGHLLPACTVMVTTRPWALANIPTEGKSRIDQHIEIVGFTKENIFSFIDSVIEEGMRPSVRVYVNSNPHILSAMYNPLCAQIVLCVYREYSQDRGHSIPHTMTELYTSYTRIVLKGHSSLLADCANIDLDIANHPASMKTHYDCICKMAYEGTMKQDQKLVFHVENPREFETLGLMRCVQPLYQSATNRQSSFHFVHFTLQEFMAAMYISNHYTSSDLVKLFETTNYDRYGMVLRFLAGLTKFQDAKLKHIFPSPTFSSQNKRVRLHPDFIRVMNVHSVELFCNIFFTPRQISWLYESQNKQLFLPYRNQIIAFTTKCARTDQEHFELGYCIAACGAIVNLEVDCCVELKRLQMVICGLKSVAKSDSISKIQYLSIRAVSDEFQQIKLTRVYEDQPFDADAVSMTTYQYRETLQSLIYELSPKTDTESETGPVYMYSNAVYFPPLFSTVLKEIDLPNSVAWEISDFKSLQVLTIAFSRSGPRELQQCFCKLIKGNKTLRKVIVKYPNSNVDAYNALKLYWYVDIRLYSVLEFSSEQFSSKSLSSFTQKVLLQDFPLHSVESIKLFDRDLRVGRLMTNEGMVPLQLPRYTSLRKLCVYGVNTIMFQLSESGRDRAHCSLSSSDHRSFLSLNSITHITRIIETPILHTLKLGLNSWFKEIDVVFLMNALCKNTSIKSLIIYVDIVYIPGYKYNNIEHSCTCTESECMISIPACHLDSGSSAAIQNMLKTNRTLESFEMVFVTINDEPHYLYPILEVLIQNTTLKALLLREWHHDSIPPRRSSTPTTGDAAFNVNESAVYNLLTENQTLEILEISLYARHYPSLLRGLLANKVLKELYFPREHAPYIIDCPEYFENAHRVQFTDPLNIYFFP